MTALTHQQMATFQRAVARRSQGQIRIPAVELSIPDANSLWRDIVAIFGPDEGRVLSPRERTLLGQRAWRRSAGQISLTQDRLTFGAGIVLWSLAGKLAALHSPKSPIKPAPSGPARAARVAVIGLAATQLAACTSLWGGNIKGRFACSAPGGTCAPSTVIDDQALSVIQSARPAAPMAQPWNQSRRPAGKSAWLKPLTDGRSAATSVQMAYRERRMLKVVFPAYVDGTGNFHEPRVVHTVADPGGWMQLSGGKSGPDEPVPAQADRTPAAALAPSDPPAGTIGTTPPAPNLGDRQLTPAADLSARSSGQLPDPQAVAEARARGATRAASSPLDAIRTDVEERLRIAPKAGQHLVQPTAPGLTSAQLAEADEPLSPAHGTTQGPAQGKELSAAAPAPRVANPPANFSGKVAE